MKKELQRPYTKDYNLLTAQDLWQAHYHILLIVLLKDFIKIKVNMKKMIKKCEIAELNIKIVTALLNMQTLKMI